MSSSGLRLATVFVVAAALAGCAFPAKFSGGGNMPSTSGVSKDKANLGFNAADCDPDNTDAIGHFTFHDKTATGFAASGGVKFGGFVVAAGLCTATNIDSFGVTACDSTGMSPVPVGFCPSDNGYLGVDLEYESTNPKLPGDGNAVACVKDNGEGSKATSDWVSIRVLTGPFTGYTNVGTIKGNVQRQVCTCTDGVDNDGDGLIDANDPGCNLVNGLNGDEKAA